MGALPPVARRPARRSTKEGYRLRADYREDTWEKGIDDAGGKQGKDGEGKWWKRGRGCRRQGGVRRVCVKGV